MSALSVKQKLIKYYYFIAINSLLLAIAGIGYFLKDSNDSYLLVPNGNDWLAIIYIITFHFIYIVFYLFIFSIFLLPTIWLSYKKRTFIQLSVVIFLVSIAILDILMFYMHGINITDTFVSVCYNTVMLESSNIVSTKKLKLYLSFFMFCIFEYMLYSWITNNYWLEKIYFTRKYFILIILCLLTTTVIYFTSTKTRRQNLTAYTQHLPWIIAGDKQVVNKIDGTNKHMVLTKFIRFISGKNKQLNYPVHPLQIQKINNPPNILIIAIDGWRKDCFNAVDSPNLWDFAKNGKIFHNHKSAANGTLGGIFSLFYAIPASYWHSFIENKRIPILFDRLQQLDYQISVITSAGTPLPYFISNQQLLNAKLEFEFNTNVPYKKDKMATNSLLSWYKGCNKSKPWFAFIFYDSAHGNNFPEDYSKDYHPVNDNTLKYHEIVNRYGKDYFINTYKLGVHYADFLAGKILEQLEKSDELENTLVIITSDHGKEFNDTGQNQWGHGTNFTDYQMQVPFAIVGPKINDADLNWQKNDLTTNYDVVPTIMQNYLGVTNDTSDYSIGINLLSNQIKREWMLATGFGLYSFQCSIIDNNLSVRWLPSGRYWFTDNMNRYLNNQIIDNNILNQALEYMTRFIKK